MASNPCNESASLLRPRTARKVLSTRRTSAAQRGPPIASILWLTGEHYATHKPLSYHVQHLPKDVRWYADPSGAAEIAELRCPVSP